MEEYANTTPANNARSITVGVITHEKRFDCLAQFLELLSKPLTAYEKWSGQTTELIIVNNSGPEKSRELADILSKSNIATRHTVRQLDSPKNNIATGRNLAIEQSSHQILAFIDDDEIPTTQWLIELAKVMFSNQCAVVSGPVHPQFPAGTSTWLKSIDLHNSLGKLDGDDLRHTATANVLIDLDKIGVLRFDEKYGRSGGSDTEFFFRVTDNYERILWAEKAAISETIPPDRASFRYFRRRCISQGWNFRQIKMERGDITSLPMFKMRAVLVILLSLCVASILLIIRSNKAGNWLKRAFANIGFIIKPSNMLYE